MKRAVILVFFLVFAPYVFAEPSAAGKVSELQFNQLLRRFNALYSPVAVVNGAVLRLEGNWNDGSHEAHAGKKDNDWSVYIAGGVARSSDADLDSLTVTFCHEFGHQFAGYPFVNLPGNVWNSKEGATDYYAAFVCARQIWNQDDKENSKFRRSVDRYAQAKCDQAWAREKDQNLCYRIVTAGQKMLNVEAKIASSSLPNFSTPEIEKKVTLQCRLDSILQGATCTASYILTSMPGYLHPDGIESEGAMKEARKAACDKTYGYKFGLKPSCWWD